MHAHTQNPLHGSMCVHAHTHKKVQKKKKLPIWSEKRSWHRKGWTVEQRGQFGQLSHSYRAYFISLHLMSDQAGRLQAGCQTAPNGSGLIVQLPQTAEACVKWMILTLCSAQTMPNQISSIFKIKKRMNNYNLMYTAQYSNYSSYDEVAADK